MAASRSQGRIPGFALTPRSGFYSAAPPYLVKVKAYAWLATLDTRQKETQTVTKIFYASMTGNTERIAHLIQEAWGEGMPDPEEIGEIEEADFLEPDGLILGISTWEMGRPSRPWVAFMQRMDAMDLTGKTVALFGLGNASFFANQFVNALGALYEKIIERGGRVVGFWPTRGYTFDYSRAVRGRNFVGLVIDEESQKELTSERVTRWVETIRPEFD